MVSALMEFPVYQRREALGGNSQCGDSKGGQGRQCGLGECQQAEGSRRGLPEVVTWWPCTMSAGLQGQRHAETGGCREIAGPWQLAGASR